MHMLHYFFKKTFRMSANILLSFKLTFTGSWANTFCGLVMSVQAAVQLTRPFMSSCWPNQGLWYSLTAEWQPCTCKSLVCKLLQDFQHSCKQRTCTALMTVFALSHPTSQVGGKDSEILNTRPESFQSCSTAEVHFYSKQWVLHRNAGDVLPSYKQGDKFTGPEQQLRQGLLIIAPMSVPCKVSNLHRRSLIQNDLTVVQPQCIICMHIRPEGRQWGHLYQWWVSFSFTKNKKLRGSDSTERSGVLHTRVQTS